ncbi:velvet factor-domain-containing protein [Aspergillus multicolor]|uniref:velvet factor family protein n=1 Tax=Aspergillus multicolor TaxID=41759 RepID=UPI003CCCB260
MTTHVGSQNTHLHQLGQKSSALVAGSSIHTCEASPRQMSGAPFQRWTYIPDGRPTNVRNHPSDETRQRQTPVTSPSYVPQEPPRFLSQGHEPTMMQSASYSRLPMHGYPIQSRALDTRSDPKYMPLPTTTCSLAQYSIQRPSTSRNVESAGSSGPYYDVSSRSRSSVGSVSRATDVDSQYSSSSTTFPSPVHSDRSPIYPTIPSLSGYQQHVPVQQRHVTAGMPSGFENILHHYSPSPSPPPRRASPSSRYRLYIRQQPIAARACGAGDRDRRPVDPPPIIQLLLTDFNPNSEEDRSILQDPRFTVGCLLYPVQDPSYLPGSCVGPPNPHPTPTYPSFGVNIEDSNAPGNSTPLLSGKAFASPFYVDEEPDPNSAPAHPSSTDDYDASPRTLTLKPRTGSLLTPPASFFIFSDLSVRTAGLYRLQFRLMNWGAIEDTGQSMPILAEVWSDPFRVYPAKDFPGMRDSSLLTLRLKELGFVELKTRGQGMGKGRRVGVAKAGSRAQVE